MIVVVFSRFIGIRLKIVCRDESVGREEERANIPVPATLPSYMCV